MRNVFSVHGRKELLKTVFGRIFTFSLGVPLPSEIFLHCSLYLVYIMILIKFDYLSVISGMLYRLLTLYRKTSLRSNHVFVSPIILRKLFFNFEGVYLIFVKQNMTDK